MINDQEKYLNIFLNAFFIYHQEKNNLLLDNLEIFLQLMHNYDKLTHDFVCNNHIKFDNKKIKKTTIIDNIRIINSFYDKMGINLDVEELINNGTINLTPIISEDNEMIFGGINNYLNGHKNINIKNNGNIIDSIILVHELSHYRNQPNNNRGQVNDLLTESLAFAEELIYTDYLDGLGFTYESYNMKKTILKILYQRIEKGYYLLKMYLLYDKLGKVSKDNYKYYYKDDSTYKEALDSSINCLKYDKDDILDTLWYTLASHLSIYIYMCYKNNPLFINNIKNFNDNLLNKRDLQECLSTIGIDGYTKESRDKVELAIKEFIEELEDKKQEKILKLK